MPEANYNFALIRNRNFNIPFPPPPGKPWAFVYFLCPGRREFEWQGLRESKEFDLSLSVVGKIKLQLSGFKRHFFFFGRQRHLLRCPVKGYALLCFVFRFRIFEGEILSLETQMFEFRKSKF